MCISWPSQITPNPVNLAFDKIYIEREICIYTVQHVTPLACGWRTVAAPPLGSSL